MPRVKKNLKKSRLGSEQSYTSSETPTEEQILLTEALEETVQTIHSGDQLHNETVEETTHSESYENSEQEQSSSRRKKARIAWEVDVMSEEGTMRKKKMKTIEVWSLPSDERIIVPLDEYDVPICDAAALLTGILAELAQLTSSFPINYTDWRHVPDQYKEDIFSKTIMPKFHFQDEEKVKEWIFKNIVKKWKDFKSKLWDEFYDPSLSRDELISNCPTGIHRDQWSSFVIYRLSEKSMEMCRKNAASRKCQTIPHTSGSKSFARRRAEMEIELGRKVGRSEVWLDTHKKKDGTYVNEAAKNISEKVVREMGQNSYSRSQLVSHDDALGKVFGKEHPGRVRGMGFGPSPSNVFKSSTSRVNTTLDPPLMMVK
ncbi:hypothetical protein DH2020_018787 [Rehmannia glutinosa]|uniref:Transposase n=1 Tax=Rehmannia glutinosa TaxID=99300 RepID=A0ABR0WL33_REHGL